jgi:glycosyltransferase involved in cell wall biosynthesis
MKNNRCTVLVLSYHYLPGYKGGGPIRTLSNMVDKIGDEIQFKIVTSDRDLKDASSYHGITLDQWGRVGQAEVIYLSADMRKLRGIKQLLCSTESDIFYLNSFFSPNFTIKPLLLRRLRLIPCKPVILASRGEFSAGALSLKSMKKLVYISIAKIIGLYRDIVWQASSEQEEADIRRWFGNDITVVVAPNMPPTITMTDESQHKNKKIAGYINIVYLSRISKMKNLYGALKMLIGLNGKIQFNIYGPIEDEEYWKTCEKIIKKLPKDIEVSYHGPIKHDKVGVVMRMHDLFFLPTLGENFGHVILEALVASCLVLLSDQTPWRDLEKKGVGWDLPLHKPDMFHQVLQRCVEMDDEEYTRYSENARQYGQLSLENIAVVEQNKKLFNQAMDKKNKNQKDNVNV